jgi:3-methyladenine DNA glycosylase AlkD
MARKIGRDPALARNLWTSGIHEARILACLIDDPGTISRRELNARIRDIDSWDICDLFCNNLVVDVPFAWKLALDWINRRAEFVRRAGFSTLASLAVHDRNAVDADFIAVLPLLAGAADDERNYVRKAVNWALRQIGKRNRKLHRAALALARTLRKQPARSARWIAADAIRELTSPKTVARLRAKKTPA